MAERKALILGSHPLAESLILQYLGRGFEVTHKKGDEALKAIASDAEEVVLLSEGDDNATMAHLARIAAGIDMSARNGKKLLCHLMLVSQKVLRTLQTTEFCDAIREKMDVYPFTMDDVWSRSIQLDREPITLQSDRHVHLVIFGMNDMAEAVAISAAHVAHYPNYVRDHSLRTRITLVETQAEQKSKDFIKRYQHLFDNSYYRIVKPSEEEAIKLFHKPMYSDVREDFVDVEWEFVEAEVSNDILRNKLSQWASDSKQLLTIVMADSDNNKNISEAMLLPKAIYKEDIPVYIYSRHGEASVPTKNMRLFGMQDSGYDTTLPLARMAKNINFIYGRCYADEEQVRYAAEIDFEERETAWSKLPMVKRMSSIYNAMSLATKMHSIGLKEDEWDKFYDIPQHDIEILAQTEHNRWSVEELILGWRPCTEEEQQRVEADITQKRVLKSNRVHYDLRAYDDLRPDETGKSAKIYDICLCSCLPLIAKTFAEDNGEEP